MKISVKRKFLLGVPPSEGFLRQISLNYRYKVYEMCFVSTKITKQRTSEKEG